VASGLVRVLKIKVFLKDEFAYFKLNVGKKTNALG
jgi:hypothetical protein